MRQFSKAIGLVVATFFCFSAPAQAQTAKTKPKTKSKTTSTSPSAKGVISRNPYIGAIVVDAATGRTLFEENADAKGYPASTLKLMDLLIILEKIEQHQLSFQDQVVVSAKSARTGGSEVWLKEKEVFTIDELLYALMVQSANDAAVALAEKVAGSTEAFVELMNQRARALGMVNTTFHSVHGLPPGQGQLPDVTTARDFVVLCREVLKHPDTLRYTSTRNRPFRPNNPAMVAMRNHNHLLWNLAGCDGLKTGYIRIAGYSIAVTAARNGHRVIVFVLGSPSWQTRDAKATALVNRGFAALGNPQPAVARPAQPRAASAQSSAR